MSTSNGTCDRAMWGSLEEKLVVKPRFGISLCLRKGPAVSLFLSLSFCPCLIPWGVSQSWSRNTEPWRWTLLAINCCETACFLINASTSHQREVKKKDSVWHGCVSSCMSLHVCIHLYMWVCMYLVCLLCVWCLKVCVFKFVPFIWVCGRSSLLHHQSSSKDSVPWLYENNSSNL